jgi:hypothetical protein
MPLLDKIIFWGTLWFAVSIIVGLVIIVLWGVVQLIKKIRAIQTQYKDLVNYLIERGAKKVVLVSPKWVKYGMIRLYSADGTFLEELPIQKEFCLFIEGMKAKLKEEGFEVEVKRT